MLETLRWMWAYIRLTVGRCQDSRQATKTGSSIEWRSANFIAECTYTCSTKSCFVIGKTAVAESTNKCNNFCRMFNIISIRHNRVIYWISFLSKSLMLGNLQQSIETNSKFYERLGDNSTIHETRFIEYWSVRPWKQLCKKPLCKFIQLSSESILPTLLRGENSTARSMQCRFSDNRGLLTV